MGSSQRTIVHTDSFPLCIDQYRDPSRGIRRGSCYFHVLLSSIHTLYLVAGRQGTFHRHPTHNQFASLLSLLAYACHLTCPCAALEHCHYPCPVQLSGSCPPTIAAPPPPTPPPHHPHHTVPHPHPLPGPHPTCHPTFSCPHMADHACPTHTCYRPSTHTFPCRADCMQFTPPTSYSKHSLGRHIPCAHTVGLSMPFVVDPFQPMVGSFVYIPQHDSHCDADTFSKLVPAMGVASQPGTTMAVTNVPITFPETLGGGLDLGPTYHTYAHFLPKASSGLLPLARRLALNTRTLPLPVVGNIPLPPAAHLPF